MEEMSRTHGDYEGIMCYKSLLVKSSEVFSRLELLEEWGNLRWEVGERKWEVGGRRWEVGGKRWEGGKEREDKNVDFVLTKGDISFDLRIFNTT